MSEINGFRDLIAWQRALDLANRVYEVTEAFPSHERFGLAAQMRRAAISIASNIAEGHRRRSKTYVYHLEIALGSNGELETQCEIASRRKFIGPDEYRSLYDLLNEVGRLTRGLMRSVAR